MEYHRSQSLPNEQGFSPLISHLSHTPWFPQVQLLVRLLPLVSEESCFALKGGTAINLFVRDLPRLSVDIDLAYLPLEPRSQALQGAKSALLRIQERANSLPGISARMQSERPDALRILVAGIDAQIKIEVSPVARGTLLSPVQMEVSEAVEDAFGFASIAVVDLPDLYGGKICAALDRQHPRDLFDVKLLLEANELSRAVFDGFLVYLLGHPRPVSELLAPNFKALQPVFDNELVGMTLENVSEQDAAFLLPVKRNKPDWSLFAYPEAAQLSAVQWKMMNIGKMPPVCHTAAVQKLEEVLSCLVA